MTQDQFNSLFKAGDSNALWAAVENYIQSEVNAAFASKAAEVEAIQAAHDALQVSLDSEKEKKTELLQSLTAVVNDPETPTDSAVLSIVAEASKDDRQKTIDAANAEIARQQEIIASLS